MSLSIIAIVGRPNVGKSSLFNRILQRRLAVVSEQSGVTRDRNYADGEWAGRRFRLIDTGGIVDTRPDRMEALIVEQARVAIEEADVVLLVVDTQSGVDPTDLSIARSLKKTGKPCLLVANKADNEQIELSSFEFLKLGLGAPQPVSATTGRGSGELLDQAVALLPPAAEQPEEDATTIRVALVGRPNVGKSSFINKLIGHERLIVSPEAGTTRDAVDTPFELEGQKFILVDTAGLRRKYRVHEDLEFYTSLRSKRAIEDSDVAVVLVDATESVTLQDQKVLEQVFVSRRPAVLAVNKWDLVEKDMHTADKFTREINDTLASHAFLPVIYVSALTGQRLSKVLSIVVEVYRESRKRIPTPGLNEFLQKIIARKHPPSRHGKYIKIRYLTQTEVAPPTFVFFVNYPQLLDKSYLGYLTNQLRQEYGFVGVPIRIKFRK